MGKEMDTYISSTTLLNTRKNLKVTGEALKLRLGHIYEKSAIVIKIA
jgi:hypothetical protein